MTGASPWTLEDLAQVAELFGESLVEMLSDIEPSAFVHGLVEMSGQQIACHIWLSERVAGLGPGTLAAVETPAGWLVLPASEVGGRNAYGIKRLEAKPIPVVRKSVAILDDDQDLTNSISAHFRESGYDARPFYATADLLNVGEMFDGYVMDWIVGETSVVKLIAAVRAKAAKCPIVVLTAQVMTGAVDEGDIADAVKRFDFIFHEKPVRTSILVATLARGLTHNESQMLDRVE